MTWILAVANQKGGVGKTTTVVNLGSALASLGQRVVVVDMDPQGNATTGLGVAKDGVPYSTYDMLTEGIPLNEVLVSTRIEGVSLVPSNLSLAGAEIELVSMTQREWRLKQSLALINPNVDVCLIDCPPSLGLLTLNALTAAEGLLIPVQCEYYALEGLGLLLTSVERVKESLNPSLEIAGVLLTMFDARTNLSLQVVEEVKRFFRGKVYTSIIPRNVRLSEAPSHGLPINRYDARSRGAQVYQELAMEVVERGKARIGARAVGTHS